MGITGKIPHSAPHHGEVRCALQHHFPHIAQIFLRAKKTRPTNRQNNRLLTKNCPTYPISAPLPAPARASSRPRGRGPAGSRRPPHPAGNGGRLPGAALPAVFRFLPCKKGGQKTAGKKQRGEKKRGEAQAVCPKRRGKEKAETRRPMAPAPPYATLPGVV